MSSYGNSIAGANLADPLVSITLSAPLVKAPKLITINEASLLAEAQGNLSELIAGMRSQGRGRNVGRSDAAPIDEEIEQPHPDERRREVRKIATLLADGKTDWKSAYALMQSHFPSAQEQAAILAELRQDVRLSAKIRAEIASALAMLEGKFGDPVRKARTLASLQRLVFGERDEFSFRKFQKLYQTLFSAGVLAHTTYRELIEAFGFSKRGSVLELLERTAVADIGGDLRDRTADECRPILALLLQLRLLRCADALLLSCVNPCIESSSKSVDGDGEPTTQDADEQALVALLLAVLDDEHDAYEVLERCLERVKRSGGAEDVRDWSRRVLRGLNSVPVELYCDLAYRDTLLKGLQAMLAEQLRLLPGWGRQEAPAEQLGTHPDAGLPRTRTHGHV
jgi:hypothetical protein